MPNTGDPLVVLITNNTARYLAGTERYVESVSRYLIEHGHHPIVYSTQLGEAATLLRQHGVIVVSDLGEITITPDIIHGHHHLDLACALTHFPQTPCIAFIHGVIPWEEHSFPDIQRIYRHVTVSKTIVPKACTEGVPPEKIERLPNFVDRRRFAAWHERRGISTASGECRALLFSNHRQAAEAQIRRACDELGISLDCRGASYGGVVREPEALFPDYDLVFAYGKSAMEALCSGCEVILSSDQGIGPLITPQNFQRLHDRNFGFSVCCSPPSLSALRREITIALERRVRGESPLNEACISTLYSDAILPQLIQLYRDAIAHWHEQRASHDPIAEMRAFSRYFRFLQLSRFGALEAQHHHAEQAARLEQTRTDLAMTLQEFRSRPMTSVLRHLGRRWRRRRPAGQRDTPQEPGPVSGS